ncbi:Hsp20 family protein [Pseudohalioglobus lutimaris]|uniref:Heat-shock protein n=1 Tax=Pseudohalioglobus lutimaris TaxID=1737061 RepID=A0A2N5WXX9_9GAMM|nr:Hsp20 family protein [Pseudohalioglobus lutimaris]PLW67100.1 heat-shock protein [Pseudohalioglobus lutimaris]
MNSIDLSPLYRSSVGYDRLSSLIDSSLRASEHAAGYPPYNIQVLEEDSYAISLAVAGFDKHEIEITVENSVLTIRGNKQQQGSEGRYLYQGIANRAFERRFNLAEYVEVTEADLGNGLLTVKLKREIPEAMKPRKIPIGGDEKPVLEHEADADSSRQGPVKAA